MSFSGTPAHIIQVEDTVERQQHVHAGDGEVVDNAIEEVVDLLRMEKAHKDKGPSG